MTTRRAAPKTDPAAAPEPEVKPPADKPAEEKPNTETPDAADEGESPEAAAMEEEERAPKLAELLKDPKYAAQQGKLLAAERKKVETEIRKRLQEEASEAAKRASMAETDRLKAELKDASDALSKRERELREAHVDRDINRTLVESGVRLQEGALDVLRDKVLKAVKDEEDPDYAAAVEEVLGKYAWLRQSGKEAKAPQEPAEDRPAPRQPGGPKGATPAKPEPKKTVDVMGMSPQEYAKHRREKGIT